MESIIARYFHSVPTALFVVPPILILVGLFLVFMPNSTRGFFLPFWSDGARRIFSWAYLTFVSFAFVLMLIFSFNNIR